jgi:hypothetical protein
LDWYPINWSGRLQGDPEPLSIREIREAYMKELRDLNFVGMVEPAFYVHLPRSQFHIRRLVSWHVHGVVWGISDTELSAICKGIDGRHQTLIPRMTAAKPKPIQQGDLLKVLGYAAKAPRKQYSIGRKKRTDGFKQSDKPLSGPNRVRLHALIRDIYLDELAIGTGEGADVMKVVKKEALAPFRRRRREGRI